MRKATFRIIALFLVVVLMVPTVAMATAMDGVMPRASDYLVTYTSYICHMGGGDLEIWFRIMGTQPWADIGSLRIQLYESTDRVNWTWVETFQHYDYDTMLGHNTGFHMDHVDYEGTLGKFYLAYVCIWAGDENNNGDARYIWTDVEYASPFNP